MGPTPQPNNNQSTEENYEQDGWFIGYEVQMEGLGLVNVYSESNNHSDSDSEGYVGPEHDSDDEVSVIRRAGYMPVSSHPRDDDSDEDCDVKANDRSGNPRENNKPEQPASSSAFGSSISPPIQQAFQNALNSAEAVHLSDKDFSFLSIPNDIELSPDKIDEIKASMASIHFNKPDWDDPRLDESISKFLNSTRRR